MQKKKTSTASVNWINTEAKTIADFGDHALIFGNGKPGGDGPNPVDVLLSSLGACMTQAIVLIASKRRIDLNNVHVAVEGDIDLKGIFNRASGIRTGVQEIRYQVTVDSPAPREKIEKIIEQAEDICPVRDTLKLGALLINSTSL